MLRRFSVFLFVFSVVFIFGASGAFAQNIGAAVVIPMGQPTTIAPGEVTELEITLSNSDDATPITNVAFSNSLPGTLPDGLSVAGATTYTCFDPNVPSTIGGSGSLVATVGTQAISLTGGMIPAASPTVDAFCTITIPVTVGTTDGSSATFAYEIQPGAVTVTGAGPNVGLAVQSVNRSSISQPVIDKNFTSGTLILGGAPTTLTITVDNPNASVTIPNFSITDTFPVLAPGGPLIQVANPPNATSNCSGAGVAPTFTPVAGANSITATGGTVAQGGDCTLTVDVEAVHTNGVFQTTNQTNRIDRATDFTNDFGIEAQADATDTIRTRSPFDIAKSFSSPEVAGGQTASLSIVFRNDGDSSLTVTSFTDDPIDGTVGTGFGLVLGSAPTMSCTGAGTPGTFALVNGGDGFTQTANSTVAAGETCTITGTFTATPQTANVPISFTNSIAEGAVGLPAGIVSEAASASILVAQELQVFKSVDPTNPAPGSPVEYDVTLNNFSATDITDIDITDTLTDGQTFLTGIINGNDFTPTVSGAGCGTVSTTNIVGDTVPVLTLSLLPQRINSSTPGSCVVTFFAMTDPGGSGVVNNVLNAGDVTDGGSFTNGAPSQTTSTTISSNVISATKSFSPAGPLPENTVTRLSVTLTNLSVNPITTASLIDNLPAANVGTGQMVVADPPNFASTCGTPSFTAVPGNTSFNVNGATVPARANNGTGAPGTCVVELDVVGSAGTYGNVAMVDGTETLPDGMTRLTGTVNSNTATIVYTSSLSGTKSFSPGAVSSGGRSRVTVRLDNSAGLALTNVSVTDPLPAGMILATPVNPSTTCAGMSSFGATPGDTSITFSGGTIPGFGSCDVLFDVTATGVSNFTNTIPTGNITADGGVQNQTPVSATLLLNTGAGVIISNTLNPSTLTFPGQTSQLTIQVTADVDDLTNLTLTDFFTDDGTSGGIPNGLQIAATPNASTTCPGGVVTAVPQSTSLSVSGVSLLATTSCTFVADVTSITTGAITDVIPANAVVTDQGITNGTMVSTSLTTQGNLGVAKSFTPNTIAPGARSRLAITFFNPSTSPAANISVLDVMPANVTIPAGPNPTTTCSGAVITVPANDRVQVTGANLPAASGTAASSCVVEIDVTSSTAGEFTNTIAIGEVTADVGGVPVQNNQPASDVLRVFAPLEIHKAFDGQTLDTGSPSGFTTGSAARAVGDPATLTIRLENPNATDLTAVNFVDSFPAGLFVAPTPNASTTCAGGLVLAPESAASISLTGATVPGSGNCDVTVDVISNIVDSYVNTIPAGDVNSAEGVTNDEPTNAELVISDPPVVSKEFSPVAIGVGGTSRLTIFLGNDNDTPATLNSIFTDTLPTAPDNLIIATPNNLSTTCPGSVTATSGSGSVSYANGAQVPVNGCTINVDVTASTPGTYNNNIPAGALQTNFGGNQEPANASLEVTTLGFISGRVFADNNVTPNGTFEPGTDTPLSGQTIELRSGLTCAGALLDTDTTDIAGNYSFLSLSAGTFSVCQVAQPSGTVNGTTTAGTIVASNGSTGVPGSASNPTGTTSQVVSIVLNDDGLGGEISGSIDNNFAEIIPSSISGRVFMDENNNGIQNGADFGIAGETIELLDSLGAVITTATTDANGDYTFTGLLPDTYSVRQPNQPVNTNSGMTVAGTVPNGGTPGTPTAPTTVPSEIASITLPPNTSSTGNNFAELSNTRSISGAVFVDLNANSSFDGSDFGLSGVTLNLSGTDDNGDAVTASVTTDADGNYTFSNLPPGTYTVTQPDQPSGTLNALPVAGTTGGTPSNPTGTSSEIATINLLGANTLSTGNDFPELPGPGPDLTLAKTHSPVSFAEGSSGGIFTLTPSNVGTVDTSGTVTIVDTLPAGLTLSSTPTGTGWTCSGAVGASTFTCTSTDVIASGGGVGNTIDAQVTVGAGLAGQLLTNTAVVSGGGEPPGLTGNNMAEDTVAISAGATVAGSVWFDTNSDNVFDLGEQPLSNWTAELLLNGSIVATDTTDTSGAYQINNVSPGSGYELRFREPTTGEIFGGGVSNESGVAGATGTRDTGNTPNGGTNAGNPAGADTTEGKLDGLTILAGDNIVEQSLPLDPAGVIYNAVTRQPVAGAQITITGPAGFDPVTQTVGGTDTITTGADGFYQFLLLSTAPSGVYTLEITSYPPGFIPVPSTLIPVCTNTITVDNVPDPALIQTSPNPPVLAAPLADPGACPAATAGLNATNQASTQHFFDFTIDTTLGTGSADVLNNHIPLDPAADGSIVITKTTPVVTTGIGQFVPYTISVTNTTTTPFTGVDVQDVIPAGFRFVEGSAAIDGVPTPPTVNGLNLTWSGQTLPANTTLTYRVILVVGSGVDIGEYTNRAFASIGGTTITNIATATVRVVPDPIFDCSDLIGKVFDDQNANGYQDKGEPGIPNVRLATVRGLLVTTDDHGRFHVACAEIPDAERGSNFLMKLDERTLPSGYRVTTENPRVVRMTRGKLVKMNFGAAVHRVVRIDIMNEAFETDSVDLKPEWQSEFDNLVEILKSEPSVLRLAYEIKGEGKKLAKKRVKHLTKALKKAWKDKNCCHELMIEHEFMDASVPQERRTR